MNGIDVTGVDKMAFAKAVYRLSVPQGMGILHAVKGDLDEATAKEIASTVPFSMDYIHGRACKMHLGEKDGRLMAPSMWYDHTDDQYERLLSEFGFSRKAKSEHGGCCECPDCLPHKPSRHPDWEKANAAPTN